MKSLINVNDVKWDLLQIIKPYDGRLMKAQWQPVIRLFDSYLRDLKSEHLIKEFAVSYSIKDSAITYDVQVKFNADKSAKKLKIHVGTFALPWCGARKQKERAA